MKQENITTQYILNAVKRKRKEKNISQIELSEKINRAPTVIVNLENGRLVPNIDLLYDLAEVFDCSIYDLIPSRRIKTELPDVKGSETSASALIKIDEIIKGVTK